MKVKNNFWLDSTFNNTREKKNRSLNCKIQFLTETRSKIKEAEEEEVLKEVAETERL